MMTPAIQTSSAETNDTRLARFGIESHWFKQGAADRRLLFVYAHPDDESFGNAGTVLRYAHAGVAVHYACATRGESGSVQPEHLQGYADVAALRTAEQMCAARALGLAGVHFLGYRDSGMPGTPDNDHPASLYRAPLHDVSAKVVALIRALRPQVVVTFGPYGGYGHPDHIKMHKATIAAFPAAWDPAWYAEQLREGLEPWKPAKLYYSTIATIFIRTAIAVMRLRGGDPRRVGVNQDIDMLRIVQEQTPTTAKISSKGFLLQREAAWDCHASQATARNMFRRLPIVLRERLSGDEQFTRVVPPWNGREKVERDLFAGT